MSPQDLNNISYQDKEKRSVILIGNPNVGKSVIFGILTGKYVTVSNYPGTTVEISRGELRLNGKTYAVIDTPGVANLLPMSVDEVVARDIILSEERSIAVQVADSKNLLRTLLITLQIAEMNLPLVLVLNMADEARERRISIDYNKLSQILGVDVIPTVAVNRVGTDKIFTAIEKPKISHYQFRYDPFIEEAIAGIERYLPDMNISKRSLALMALCGDSSLMKWLEDKIGSEDLAKIQKIIRETRGRFPDPLEIVIHTQRIRIARELAKEVSKVEETPRKGILFSAGKISMHPIWGIPILLGVLILMYLFVGKFAAGTVVDFLQNQVFGSAQKGTGMIMPILAGFLNKLIPFPLIRDLFIGEYGLISVGLTYSLAIVFPIVTAFFLFFSFLEDSGYLPRLAIMTDRLCKTVGLNGKAILPMVLGLGCGTMAVISSRILDTPKERNLAILLLALGIPCSAQMGVVMGLLAGTKITLLLLWIAVVLGSMIAVGYIANRILPGETSDFLMEIPPLRIPSLRNIIIKTFARIEWYLKEAVPIFLLATFILFIVDRTGILSYIYQLANPIVVHLLGLPIKATDAFIMGFLRRDYGAAGLLDMANRGLLTGNQLFISMVTITLFLPCIAQLFVMVKERGIKVALVISVFVLFFAFLVGGFLNFLLNLLRIQL